MLAALVEADAAGMPPAAPGAEQSDSKQAVPSRAQGQAGVLLSLDAEMTGLVEAADMPLHHDKHTTKPDAISPVQGGGLSRDSCLLHCLAFVGMFALLASCIVQRRAVLGTCCAVPMVFDCMVAWRGLLTPCSVMHLMKCICSAVTLYILCQVKAVLNQWSVVIS